MPIIFIAMRYCPLRFDVRAGIVYLAALAAIVFLQFGGSMFLLRLLRVVVPASPRTQAVVDGAAARTGIAFPPVDEVDLAVANAWAFPTSGRIGVTKRVVAVFEPDELEAVLLHEAAHMQESRGQIAQRLMFTPVAVGMVLLPAVVRQYRLTGIFVYLAVLYLAMFWSRRIAHRLELRADAFSAQSVVDPVVYARALEKLYRLNLAPAVIGRLSPTHPELYDRMLAAGVTPDYPRPPRPNRAFGVSTKLLFLALMIVGVFATEVLLMFATEPRFYMD